MDSWAMPVVRICALYSNEGLCWLSKQSSQQQHVSYSMKACSQTSCPLYLHQSKLQSKIQLEVKQHLDLPVVSLPARIASPLVS